jgi:hypothetical protein
MKRSCKLALSILSLQRRERFSNGVSIMKRRPVEPTIREKLFGVYVYLYHIFTRNSANEQTTNERDVRREPAKVKNQKADPKIHRAGIENGTQSFKSIFHPPLGAKMEDAMEFSNVLCAPRKKHALCLHHQVPRANVVLFIRLSPSRAKRRFSWNPTF